MIDLAFAVLHAGLLVFLFVIRPTLVTWLFGVAVALNLAGLVIAVFRLVTG